MNHGLIIALATVLVAALLYFNKTENTLGKLCTKTPASMLFILALLLQTSPFTSYYYFILTGLVFCLGGDVFLAIPSKKAFLFGLVSFLLGHVFYTIAFIQLSGLTHWASMGPVLFVLASLYVFIRLRPFLGSMFVPVLLYIVVITLMLCGAWGVLLDPQLVTTGGIMTFLGAFLFYLSDLFVARQRFVTPTILNRVIGLPLYYSGQFLLAFSVGYIGSVG